MRIVHTEASWGWGGQEIRVLRECQLLMSAGHTITVLADPRSLIAQRASSYGVPVIHVRLGKKRIQDLLALTRVFRRIEPDVVACHSSTDHWLTAIARRLFRFSFAIVRFRHISTSVKPTWVNRWLYGRGSEMVVTTGTFIAKHLADAGVAKPDQIRSIPTGIDPHDYVSADPVISKKSLGIEADRFVVTIVATLRSWKGHAYLVEAIAQMSNPAIKLVIVGDGPQRGNLIDQVDRLGLQDNVVMAGHRSDVLVFLQASDVFVLPSYASEGVPQAILQAMALGLPIVTCPTGGIPESIENYPGAMLVEPKSAKALADALSALFARWESGSSLRCVPHIPFTAANMLSQCVQTYQDAIDIRRLDP